jgi:exopolysaccharide biosynthesis protein
MPDNSYLYSVINNGKQPKVEIGDPAYIDIQLLPQFEKSTENLNTWHNAEYIIGGIPLLIKNNQKIINYMPEKISDVFMNERYARTAVGILPNKDWLFVVVEQNPLLDIEGMSLDELAEFMLTQSCTDALNLDGGGSSYLYLKNKTTLNINSFSARPVADAIVIITPLLVHEELN